MHFLYWCFATFHQFLTLYQFFFKQWVQRSGIERYKRMRPDDLMLHSCTGTDKLLCPLLFVCEYLQPWGKEWTFHFFFSQLKIQVLMAESDLGSVWNYYFSSVLTNWIFLHFSSQFHFLICVLNNLEVPLEVDIHFKMKNQSTGFWKWQIKLSYYLFIFLYFVLTWRHLWIQHELMTCFG